MTYTADQIVLKSSKINKRNRDTATELGISEAELIAAKCDKKNIIALSDNWEKLTKFIENFDKVMTITRNEAAVIEQNGKYGNISWGPHASLVINDNIDLRIFHKAWTYAYLIKHVDFKFDYSIQIFDSFGDSVHKIYIKSASKDLINNFIISLSAEIQARQINVEDKNETVELKIPEDFSKTEFLYSWRKLQDTHNFFALLNEYKIHRLLALQIADSDLSWQVNNNFCFQMLKDASDNKIPIMVFVGNKGMIQIRSGIVKNIKYIDNWLNILDKDFNLHLNMDLISESWCVKKPTKDGDVHSLELYDQSNDLAVSFFGLRKPGMKS